jgi:hypothetical protein
VQKTSLDPKSFNAVPRYEVLEPVLNFLISHGNELATPYRWGSNPTGYFAFLKHPIDFELVEAHFDLPPSVMLDRAAGSIDYGYGSVVIRTE